jgi:hypothetical protein
MTKVIISLDKKSGDLTVVLPHTGKQKLSVPAGTKVSDLVASALIKDGSSGDVYLDPTFLAQLEDLDNEHAAIVSRL